MQVIVTRVLLANHPFSANWSIKNMALAHSLVVELTSSLLRCLENLDDLSVHHILCTHF